MVVKGTDLAALQGADGLPDAVWKKLADDGLKFALLRLLVGNETWSDIATVRKNVERASHFGIALAPYWFPYPLRHLKPEDQVDRFVKLAEGLGTRVGDIPMMCDGEWPPRESRAKDGTLVYDWRDKWKIDANFIKDWLLRALERGRELTGIRWLFYSFRYWLQCIEASKTPELGQYPLVLADYTYKGAWPTQEQCARLSVPGPWTEITMIQFDGDGGMRLPNGVDADFDVIPSEEKFQELLAMCGESKHAEIQSDISELVSLMHTQATGLVVEGAIESYRRTRLEAEPEAA